VSLLTNFNIKSFDQIDKNKSLKQLKIAFLKGLLPIALDLDFEWLFLLSVFFLSFSKNDFCLFNFIDSFFYLDFLFLFEKSLFDALDIVLPTFSFFNYSVALNCARLETLND